ncbi:MAG: aminopeptidase P family protein [Chloroflexi bacterium]|nr:aminopeptidase P family protein [Chloroflexota bacterium]
MPYSRRLTRFQALLTDQVDLVFFPISADLQYLTGVPRDIPNYGVTMHPGAWVEGAWIAPGAAPILLLPRMTAEFGGLGSLQNIEIRVLGDWDDPASMVRAILGTLPLPASPRVAVGDLTSAETLIRLQGLLPGVVFSSATALLRPLRTIKSEEEIAGMRAAGEVTERAFADVLARLKHGMTELDIVTEVDYQLRRHGALGPSFTTSLYNSGPNLPLLFGQREVTWKRVLTPPVSILFDMGAAYQGFCYDYGRTVSFGEPPAELQRVHRLVMEAQAAGIRAMRAGQATAEQVDAAARQVIADAGLGSEFRHRLGHGIGMDVHEPPFLTAGDTTVLQEGMLFTVEPSIMQFGTFSARVEDVVVARPGGGEPLTTGYPQLIVVE